jgi:hypothetical protein
MSLRVSLALWTCAGCVVLGGCAAVSDITGAVAGFAAGTATANPAVAIGVGIAVKAVTREALRYATREQHQAEQNAIAAAAAELEVGQSQRWIIDRGLTRDTYGEVRVLRVIDTPLAVCKEVAFSISEAGSGNASSMWFTTTACGAHGGWKWATAEPAVERWGNLQ